MTEKESERLALTAKYIRNALLAKFSIGVETREYQESNFEHASDADIDAVILSILAE